MTETWESAKKYVESVSVDEKELLSIDNETQKLLDEIPPGMNYQYFTDKMKHPRPRFNWRSKFSDYLRKAHPDEPVKTIVAKPGNRTGPFHWNGRRFHSTELSQLHTFPQWFELPDAETTARRLVGNAVPPQLAQSIGEGLLEKTDTVSGSDLPSARRGRTSHQTYRKRTERRLEEKYGEEVIADD